MKYTLYTLFFIAAVLLFPQTALHAQDGSAKASEQVKDAPEIRFNGLGRTILSSTGIDGDILDSDTSTIESLTDGEFLLDIAFNATSARKTAEVGSILRLRNEFGGFFGAGMSVEVRELWVKGIIADVVRYRVGDMDMAMTPYTLFLDQEDGTINEPSVFSGQRELVEYEQFYTDNNTRRMQGANVEFGLNFGEVLEDLDFKAFIARTRGTDFISFPTRLVTGGQLGLASVTLNDSLGLRAEVGLNFIHTFDDLQSGDANTGIRNTVSTLDFDITVMDKKNIGIHVLGETGMSNLETAQRVTDADGNEEKVTLTEEDDTFLEIGVEVELKEQDLKFSATYIDVGPDFFSTGAQSKRIDYNANKRAYNRIGTDNQLRMPNAFDLTRDRALYTFRISDRLMAYDPRYNNTMPYGVSTPNRTGLKVGLEYGKEDKPIYARVDGAFLQEIRGQGTFELKNFTLLRAAADFNIHRFADWEKSLVATLGLQVENTSRGGEEVEQVDLSSNLIELGIEAELFQNFDLILGAKLFTSEGSDYVPQIVEFNDVRDFPGRFTADDSETLIGAGFRYTFRKGIYLTLQYNSIQSELGNDNPNDYSLNQFFALYTMNF